MGGIHNVNYNTQKKDSISLESDSFESSAVSGLEKIESSFRLRPYQ